jgi:hypothetical protein
MIYNGKKHTGLYKGENWWSGINHFGSA